MRGAMILAAVLLFGGSPSFALPALQIDIAGGFYDTTTQTVVTTSNSFTLYFYGKKSKVDVGETHYISAAFIPPQAFDPGFDAGTIVVNGSTLLAKEMANGGDLFYGTPPLDAAVHPDLPSHGIYPSYFAELAFTFDANDTITGYNTQDDTGAALFDESGDDMYFKRFDFDLSGLQAGINLHFDGYNTKVKKNGAITLDDFVPFSHDGETFRITTPPSIPEPAGITLFVLGLAGLGASRARRQRATQQ